MPTVFPQMTEQFLLRLRTDRDTNKAVRRRLCSFPYKASLDTSHIADNAVPEILILLNNVAALDDILP